MIFKYTYEVEAIVEVAVILKIAANDEQEAFARANDGAWHGVTANWDSAKVKAVGKFTQVLENK